MLASIAAPVLECALITAAGPRAALAIAPQISAPPVFDVFHDLRWIAIYHNSWITLGLELLLMIVVRSALASWTVSLAAGNERPPFLVALGRAVAFYVIATVLMIPWVVLLFGFGIIGLSYLFFVALPAVIALGLIIHRGAAAHASGRMWQWRPTWASCRALCLAFLWLTAAGALASNGSLPVSFAASGAAGALNALASWSIARDVVGMPAATRRRQLLVPVGIVTVLATVVAGGAAGFAAGNAHGPSSRQRIKLPDKAVGHPVLVAGGFATRWRGRPELRLPNGFVQWKFSYRGIDARGKLLPYGPADTLRPLPELTRLLGEEIERLHDAYGEPVTIVAESEGALVARAFLLNAYDPAERSVDRLITLDMPKVGSGVYYPPAGEEGWGLGGGWGLRGLTALVGNIGFVRVSADAPFFRSLVGCPSLLADITTAPLPGGVSETRVIALADAVDDYVHAPGVASYVVGTHHGGLMDRAEVQQVIAQTVTGAPLEGPATSLAWVRLIGKLSSPWTLPALEPGLAPAETCELGVE